MLCDEVHAFNRSDMLLLYLSQVETHEKWGVRARGGGKRGREGELA